MPNIPVVTVFLRHRGDVLLLRRSADVGSYAGGSYAGRWSTVAGHVEADDPDASAHQEIREETGLTAEDVTLVRRGKAFVVDDSDRQTRWHVHPYLFDAATRNVTPNGKTDAVAWTAPTAILRRDTVPELWTSYTHVAPSVETVTADRTHGSAYLSMRALEVLRDRAGCCAVQGDTADSRAALANTATALLAAQPSMTALATRIHRVMHACAPDCNAANVERAAHEALSRAADADRHAAERAAQRIAGRRVCTLSRSGSVVQALRLADPAPSVVVAASHPLGEGVAVAESLAAEGLDVTLLPDASVAAHLANGAVDAVLVGADTVLPDGGVVNKTGTRMVALAAHREKIPVYVVCAEDKIAPEPLVPDEHVSRADAYDGDAPLSVDTRLFDTTPPDLLTTILTDAEAYAPADVDAVARRWAALRDWPRA